MMAALAAQLGGVDAVRTQFEAGGAGGGPYDFSAESIDWDIVNQIIVAKEQEESVLAWRRRLR